jgi:oligoendopeptidase F
MATASDTPTTEMAPDPSRADALASDVAWDLDTLLEGLDVDALLDRADGLADDIETYRGRVAELDVDGLVMVMTLVATFEDTMGRVGSYAGLRFAEDSIEEARGALMAKVQERATTIATRLVFFELEWAATDDDHVESVLGDERLAFCAHHLRNLRRYREHLLTEPEERVLTETSVSGGSAWVRFFSELSSSIEVVLPAALVGGADDDGDATVGLEQGLSLLQHPDRGVRHTAAAAVTAGLAPGLRTRAYVFNTLLLDKSVDDRLRAYPSWISSRNLSNEASDESVQALVEAVVARYDIPQRWYSLKAQVLGVERLADYDRMASVADDEAEIGWSAAKTLVLDAYASFSPDLARAAERFFDEHWIDAPVRPGKRPGAFCAYTVPDHHPYVFLNWTGRTRDVSTLAHELGHGLHAYLARQQGVFHQSTPLTLAETASVFGETVTNNALLATLDDPADRFALLAATLEDSIATVFRQVAMNRFEDAVHAHRRNEGELSVGTFGELWVVSQHDMVGDSVELTEGYRSWWSYIPHFIGTPGYVYAYAYGQLLALSVYARYEAGGADFVPDYLRMLSAGGSLNPSALGRLVGCDLEDPEFWNAGLDIVALQLDRAVDAAKQAGRLP